MGLHDVENGDDDKDGSHSINEVTNKLNLHLTMWGNF